jgi:hypothetical protein
LKKKATAGIASSSGHNAMWEFILQHLRVAIHLISIQYFSLHRQGVFSCNSRGDSAYALLLQQGMNNHSNESGDRHRSRFMVRLPELFRTKLNALKEKTGNPMSALVQWGLKLLLRRFGLWKKEDDRELGQQQAAGELADGEAT